jgi:hypothetical protein
MSPDCENVKARFLFAILRQMNLRDVSALLMNLVNIAVF